MKEEKFLLENFSTKWFTLTRQQQNNHICFRDHILLFEIITKKYINYKDFIYREKNIFIKKRRMISPKIQKNKQNNK